MGTFGALAGSLIFAFAKTYTQAVVGRIISGALSGNLGVLKSLLSEITDDTNRGKGFSYMSVAWALGTILAPLAGGMLCKPAEKYAIFRESIFADYPYALPNVVICIFQLFTAMMCVFVMKETRGVQPAPTTVAATKTDSLPLPAVATSDSSAGQPKFNLLAYARSLAVHRHDDDASAARPRRAHDAGLYEHVAVDIDGLAADDDDDEVAVELSPPAFHRQAAGESGRVESGSGSGSGSGRESVNIESSMTDSSSSSCSSSSSSNNNNTNKDSSSSILDTSRQTASASADPAHTGDDDDDDNEACFCLHCCQSRDSVDADESEEEEEDEDDDAAGFSDDDEGGLGKGSGRRVQGSVRKLQAADDSSSVADSDATTAQSSSFTIECDDDDDDDEVTQGQGQEVEGPKQLQRKGRAAVLARAGSDSVDSLALTDCSSHGLLGASPASPTPRKRRRSKTPRSRSKQTSTVLCRKTVVMACFLYGTLSAVYILWDETIPLHLKLDSSQVGFGFSSNAIGLLLSTAGGVMLLFTSLLLPLLASMGKKWLFRTSVCFALPIAFAYPLLATALAQHPSLQTHSDLIFAALLLITVVKNMTACCSFTASMIIINNSVERGNLGKVNGLGQAVAALSRAVGPALGGALWSFSLQTHFIWANFLAVFCGLVCCVVVIAFIPDSLDSQKKSSKQPTEPVTPLIAAH
jgi:MFS family permease